MTYPSSAVAADLPRSRSFRTAPNTRLPVLALLALLAALLVGGLALAPGAFAADRAFSPRFSTNDTGDIDMAGNTLLTCPASAATCASTQQSGTTTTANSTLQNNNYNMGYVDVDSDASTFDSSRSKVTLPSGSTVLFAGLYWGARTAAGSGGAAAKNAAARGTVKFQAPGDTGYTSLTGSVDDGTGGIYQGFADVTSRVRAAGAGTYTVADVQSSTGADTLAGWSLVIAYRDTTQPARNLSVFDGMKSIDGSSNGSIAVSGFKTPPAGPVNTTVGFVTYEGDAGLVGDSATLNGKTLSDAQHPATNFFDSRSSRDGLLRTGNTPSYANNLGIEQSMLTVDSSYIPNNATSATIGLTTSGDVYAPGVVTFATELYAPKIDQTKTVTDDNGGQVEQGDTLTYKISGTNSGQDGATGFVLRDPLPANTTYVPGSLSVTQKATSSASATTVAPTDAADSDIGEYDAATGRVVARLGTGANGSSGGTVAVGATYSASFKVKVGGPSPAILSGTSISNTATSSFASQSLGTALTAESTAATTVKSPDLTILKTGSGAIVRGQSRSYAIDVRNAGDAATQGAVVVKDDLPTGLSATAASGTGWTCAVTSGNVTCSRSDALAAGRAYPTITVATNVASDAPATVANSATVSGGGDGDLTNNTSTDTSLPTSSADLSVTKTADASSVAVGSPVTYTLTVANGGASPSTGAKVTDTLPAGLVYVSSDPGCVGSASASTVTCTVGTLAKGATKQFQVVARPAVGTAGTALRNTASVVGNEPDPSTTDNTSSASVAVAPVDLAVTNAIQGSPDALTAGDTYTWQVGVRNNGGSGASGSTLSFPVPAGTSVVTADLDQRCTVLSGVVTCDLGTIAAGDAVPTISIPLTVASGTTAVQTIATASSAEADAHVDDNSATTTSPVKSAVDLGVTLRSDPSTTSAGDQLTLTATVTNAGPATPLAPTVTIPVPAGTTFVRADPGCTYDAGTHAVTCALTPAQLAPGGHQAVSIVVQVGDTPGDAIQATATVHTTSHDVDASNDTAALAVPVVKLAGLSITKTASTSQAKPGDTVTYTLTAKNVGPAGAQSTVVTDTLPAGTTFASIDDSACKVDSGRITCDFGTVAAGASRTVHVAVTVDPIASTFDVNATHQFSVSKRESTLDVPAGATGTVTTSCAPLGSDYIATDGSVLRKSTDQGTGSFSDTQVLESHATADGTGWTGTVRNNTTGQLQATVNVVCVQRTLQPVAGHTHSLIVSDPIVAARTSGRQDVVLHCGTGRVAIAPGWTFVDGSGTVLASQAQGSDWHFLVDARGAAGVTLQVRCLSTTTTAADGHAHDLVLTPQTQTVDVPASSSTNDMTVKRLSCTDGKGIVASTAYDPALVALGNDPQPVNRDFWFYNPTSGALKADIGLLCLGTRTSGEIPVHDVVNTASLTTTTPDATAADDSASATFSATAASGPIVDTPVAGDDATTPATTPPTLQAAPQAPVTTSPAPKALSTARASVLSTSLRVTGSTSKATVAVSLRCATSCSGTAKLVAVARVAGTKVRQGTVLASAKLRLVAGRKGTVRLVAHGALAKALRRGHVARARLVVTTGSGAQVVRTVRLVLR